MTLDVFNHLKAHKETAGFIAEIGEIICNKKTCKQCPMAFDARLDSNGITSGCACALLCTENMSQEDLEIAKIIAGLIQFFN